MADERIGVLGLGIMGSAFSKHLVKAGFTVTGYDPVPAKRAALKRLGGVPVTSLAAAAKNPVLITSLPNADAVAEVAAQLAKSARRGTLVIETSTMPIAVKEAARRLLAKKGITLLDCTVSGTGAQARAKDLVVFVSGPKGHAKRLDPVFRGFSRSHYYAGEFGAGSKMKFIANLLVTIHNVSAAEAIVMAKRSGIDPALVVKAVGEGAGGSRMLTVRGPLMVEAKYKNPTATINILQKDIGIISEFARDYSCPTPLFSVATQFYNAAVALGYAEDDPAVVCEVLDRWAGTSPLRAKKRRR